MQKKYASAKGNGFREKAGFASIWEQGTEIYLVIMLVVYPLFMGRGYEELLFKKWALFLYASLAYVAVSVVCGAAAFCGKRENRRKAWILTDWFVLTYLAAVLISYVGAYDRETAFWGIDTWYMGLVTQLLLIGIYFGVSRGHKELKYLKI